jgi:hypothetical protein
MTPVRERHPDPPCTRLLVSVRGRGWCGGGLLLLAEGFGDLFGVGEDDVVGRIRR